MKYLYAAIIIYLCFSCKKDGGGFLGMGEGGETTVQGKITERGSGKAVPYAHVNLRSLPKDANISVYRTDTALYADENGNYSFSFTADKDRDYHVLPRHELYDNRQSKTDIRTGRKNNLNPELDPWAWVRVHIINEPPLDTIAHIGYNNFQNPPNNVMGFCRDTILIGKLLGNRPTYVIEFWRYNRLNAVENSKRVDFYVPALDTIDHYFRY